MNSDLNILADVYLRGMKQREEDFWAWEQVHEIVVGSRDVDRAWEITLLLLRKAETDDALWYVAAGPLEDLIDIYGDDALDRIEKAAKTDPRIQLALSKVGVLFYYDEFERWYELLYSYGLRNERRRKGTRRKRDEHYGCLPWQSNRCLRIRTGYVPIAR